MKTAALALAAAVAFTPAASIAGLDKTAGECDATYGSPYQTIPFAQGVGIRHHYLWHGLAVDAGFPGSGAAVQKCASLAYEKEVWVTGVGPHLITAREIDGILAVNSGGSSWEWLANGWRRVDGKAYAFEFRHRRDGVPSNTLAVFHGESHPNLVARITATAERR